MAITPKTTTSENFNIDPKLIDYVERFNASWQAWTEILGIMRPIRKIPGTRLRSYKVNVDLNTEAYVEGDEVALSQANVEEVAYKDLELTPDRMRVTAKAVKDYGAEIAVRKTRNAFLNAVRGKVLDEFYAFALTGTLIGNEDNFQMAVAMAVAKVKDKFKKMRLDYGNVVVFANTLDVGRYQGSAQITVQNNEGIEYLKDFLGANTMIISSEIPEGTVLAIPADNINLYYIDPEDGDLKELGLNYYTGNSDTSIIGVAQEGVYSHISGDTHVLYGLTLWAEYLDAIAVIKYGAGEG